VIVAAQGNTLLAALPLRIRGQIARQLEPVELNFGTMLIEQGAPVLNVFFPTRALVSLLRKVEGHPPLEVGLVGNEGLVGIGLALGVVISPVGALIQGGGQALQMGATQFLLALQTHPVLQRSALGFASALMAQITQTAACNRFHRLDQRLARWLLMCSDRMQSPDFRMTQEFLGHMLGVRRVGVTEAAHALQSREVIQYRRGLIRILDRPALEASSCECYRVVQQAYAGAGEPH